MLEEWGGKMESKSFTILHRTVGRIRMFFFEYKHTHKLTDILFL